MRENEPTFIASEDEREDLLDAIANVDRDEVVDPDELIRDLQDRSDTSRSE